MHKIQDNKMLIMMMSKSVTLSSLTIGIKKEANQKLAKWPFNLLGPH